MQRLTERVALVTGASSGIGNAIAAALGREGAAVVVADIRREPKLEGTKSVFEKLDQVEASNQFVETNITDQAAIETAVDTTIEEFGGLDILVNNAGIYYQYETHETPVEDWDETIGVNLRGSFLMSKAAMPALQESDHAKIINLSSILGLVGAENSTAYCASKGGVSNLTRSMALDYAEEEININALAPGIISTAQNAEWRENDPDLVQEWNERTPWPRFGTPEDIADAAVFLASDESDFITGHIMSVDGGWTSR
jgi:NAD(P)-dependent dehydrogenase (short-subunit alcohol dehydrogenase family)